MSSKSASSSSAAPSHRSFLTNLGRNSYCTRAALSNVLAELKAKGQLSEDVVSSSSSIKRAREDEIDIETAYGRLLCTVQVETTTPGVFDKFDAAHPLALFRHACDSTPNFHQHVRRQLMLHPSSPKQRWNICIYSDGITPGNVKKHDNKRKTDAIYWSFLELGPKSLSSEYHWMILTAARTDRVNELNGKFSALMKEMTLLFFSGQSDISRCGLIIPGAGVFFAKVGVHIADEAALKSALMMMGASGLQFCMVCPKTTKDDRMVSDEEGIISWCETDITKHTHRTDQSLREELSYLQQQRNELRKGAFADLETAVGLNYIPNGLLCCQALASVFGPVSSLMYDWMHVYLQGGLWNLEAGLLLGVLFDHLKIKYTDIHKWISDFTFPGRSNAGRNVFEKKSQVSQGNVTCGASEVLGVYNLLRLFVMQQVMTKNPPAVVVQACLCYFCLCTVLDLLNMKTKVDPCRLYNAIKLHLDFFLQVRLLLDRPWSSCLLFSLSY